MKNATYNIYPQYRRDGRQWRDNESNRPVFKSVCLNGPLPSSSHDRTVSAVDDERIHGNLILERSWYSSNGFMLVGHEKGIDEDGEQVIRYQEWWCVPIVTWSSLLGEVSTPISLIRSQALPIPQTE